MKNPGLKNGLTSPVKKANHYWTDIEILMRKLPAEGCTAKPYTNQTPTQHTVHGGTPFTSGANFSGWNVGALFYSPSDKSLDGSPLVSGGAIVIAGNTMGVHGTGNFSAGMRCHSSYP